MATKYETTSTHVLEISQFCKEHKKQFEIYCKKHDCPCCKKCVVSDHKTCHDLIQLEDMVENVKTSYGFHDIQQTMTDMVDNIREIKKDRQANLSTLKEERKFIEKEIEQIRIRMNAQLDKHEERKLIEKEIDQTRITIYAQMDKLQESMMKELYETESKESKMIGQLLDLMDKMEKEIIECQENLNNIKQHASDLQTFLAMKQMEQQMAEKDEYFTSLLKSNKLNRVSLSCKMNDVSQAICKEIRQFWEIIVSTSSCELEIVRKKEKQAQIEIAPTTYKSIDNISVTLQATIDTNLDNIRGCALLPDGRMVFSCYKTNRVRGFNKDGSQDQDFDISLQPKLAFDITYIHDNNTIAVTGGANQYISIIDVESRKVKETIPVESQNEGIVCRNNTLIYCAGGRGIQMINLNENSVSNIVTRKMSVFAYVTTFGDKLYYTNENTHTVTCCDIHGTVQWEFKDKSVLWSPRGISVDNAGNVYVVGYWSNSVVVISSDGQRHRRLLSEGDGLDSPQVVYYNKSINQLLVASYKGKAFLYKAK